MEEQDKIYLWLVVIAFIAMLVATAFGWAEILELRNQDIIAAPSSAPAAPAAAPK